MSFSTLLTSCKCTNNKNVREKKKGQLNSYFFYSVPKQCPRENREYLGKCDDLNFKEKKSYTSGYFLL
jgi:hypothetical protein